LVAPPGSCLPVATSWNSSSYAPQLDWMKLLSAEKSKCVMKLLCAPHVALSEKPAVTSYT
jgi:hypothetical protein